jgi:hypothetical protein
MTRFLHFSIFLIFFVLTISASNDVFAQKVLQIEKIGRVKTQKLHIGTAIFIKVKGDNKTWYETEIMDISVPGNMLILDLGTYSIDDITALQTLKQSTSGNSIGYKLMGFGALGLLLSPLDLAFGKEYNTNYAIIAGSSLVTGWLFRKLMNNRHYRIGKKYRLRVLDLNFEESI